MSRLSTGSTSQRTYDGFHLIGLFDRLISELNTFLMLGSNKTRVRQVDQYADLVGLGVNPLAVITPSQGRNPASYHYAVSLHRDCTVVQAGAHCL